MITYLVRKLYNFGLTLILPFYLFRLYWRGRKNPGYRARLAERLGSLPSKPMPNGIWVHAVSLGESIAATPLIRSIIKTYPSMPVIVTTTTPTGSQHILKVFKDKVYHVYLPFDVNFACQRFLNKVQPQLCILMETELWPNLLASLKQRDIPVLIANARLSLQSMKGYQKIGLLAKEMMNNLSLVAAQSKKDAENFKQLGLDETKCVITGNIKFDVSLPEDIKSRGKELRKHLGFERPVWIAASTHQGEEEIILQAFVKIRRKIPDTLLILVPRHPERFEQVAELVSKRGLEYVKRSGERPCGPRTAVFLGDTMGELPLLYHAADIAFVGGSLVPIGGHNVLESAIAGLPTLVGPHMHNFAEIADEMLAKDALIQVSSARALAEQVIAWISSSEQRQRIGQQAQAFVDSNTGALNCLMQHIQAKLK